MRDSFIFYRSFADSAAELSAKDRGLFFEAVIRYALYGEEPKVTGVPKALFLIAKQSIDSNNKKYEMGKKGGRPKKETDGSENKKPMVIENSEKTKSTETVTETDTDTVTDTDIYIAPSDSRSSEPLVADCEALILNSGSEWRPTAKDFEEYTKLYPAVDVAQEFRSMRGWCLSNPTKRKTASGIKRFVNSWLSREQNRGATAQTQTTKEKGDWSFEDFI